MKKFRFTLQTPLNVKLTMEKQFKGELAACNARLRGFLEQQEENYRRKNKQAEDYRRSLTEGMSASELPLWRVSFETVRDNILRQAKVIEQAEGEVARVQKRLVETMRERKTLEALREKQYEEYKAALRAEEAALMDDFLANQIFRGGQHNGSESII